MGTKTLEYDENARFVHKAVVAGVSGPEDEGVLRHSPPEATSMLPAAHTPVPHELRRAWATAKELAEQLEIADLPVLQRIALYVREQVFAELMAVEGYREVDGG